MSYCEIAETAPEIEKIKAESSDYPQDFDSVYETPCVLYPDTLNCLIDFYADLIEKACKLGKNETGL